MQKIPYVIRKDFNPRSHTGSDTISIQIQSVINNFNPRSHTGSDVMEFIIFRGFLYFNPRSHTGSDDDLELPSSVDKISIHAPTRGATELKITVAGVPKFQSTLPHGERQVTKGIGAFYNNFNPRSHTGSDEYGVRSGSELLNFNPRSHTGSDKVTKGIGAFYNNFNPRSHTGSDMCLVLLYEVQEIFQSTLPHGERQQYYTKISHIFIHM